MGTQCRSACGCDTSEINTEFQVGYDKNQNGPTTGQNNANNAGSNQNFNQGNQKFRNTNQQQFN